jgi:hypothetical protein
MTRRTNEIGIRLAPSAARGTALWSVLRESWTLAAVGVALEFALRRDAFGPLGAQRCGRGLFVVALAAASQPAWCAALVYPLAALRRSRAVK